MALQFTNTFTGNKEPFEPLKKGKVSLYVCGVTVYDDCHIGHARGAVVFDVLRRYLEATGYQVAHARNVTDVDDKIIDRARAEAGDDLNAAAQAIARKYEASFKEDFSKLGLLPPTHEPRATEFIPKMIRFIELLLQNGIAYKGSDGVYLSVRKVPEDNHYRYGKLSGQKLDQMLEGVRIQPGEGKKEPLDFALWKKAKPEEPSWESPWGAGRPGWHIECSAMSTDLLGEEFDIHGGGQDLVFPHHENELAQARAAGKRFSRYWLHNGLLTVNNQKMSKSLGNIVRISEALAKHPADVLRLFFLGAHYRSPIDFTWERYDEAAHAYKRLLDFVSQVEQLMRDGNEESSELVKHSEEKFFCAMDDDLNTPKALASIYELVTRAGEGFNRALMGEETFKRQLRSSEKMVRKLCGILGMKLFQISELPKNILQFRDERHEARKGGDFKEADKKRDQAKKAGFLMADTGGGTVITPDV